MKQEIKTQWTGNVAYIVRNLKARFYETYHVQPNYIKIPDWIFTELKNERDKVLPQLNISGIETFMGLQLCPTVEAHSLDDIEVF